MMSIGGLDSLSTLYNYRYYAQSKLAVEGNDMSCLSHVYTYATTSLLRLV